MPVPPIKPTAIAVYVYRWSPEGWEFLQLRRAGKPGEGGARSYLQTWQTVYGAVEPGETAVAAALRELREETGLKPRRMFQVEYVETFYFRPEDAMLLMPVFAVEIQRGDEITLNAEHDATRWVPEPHISTAFMWRTQREALSILLEQLRSPSAAMPLLTVDVAGL